MVRPRLLPNSVLPGLGASVLLVGAELIALTIAIDTASLRGGGLAGFAGRIAPVGLRLLCLTAVFTWILIATTAADGWIADLGVRMKWRLSRPALGLHIVSATVTALTSLRLFSHAAPAASLDWLAAASVTAAAAALASGCLVFVPAGFWTSMIRRGLWATPCALAAAAMTLALAQTSPAGLADSWLRLSFRISAGVLRLIDPTLSIRPERFLIASPNFEIEISAVCSGFEGVALMFVFVSGWLILFRREFRFPQALLLLPAGIGAIYTLNVVRIVALFLLGNAGASAIALGGFHSQAGWIAFIGLAVAFSLAANRVPWLAARRAPSAKTLSRRSSDLTPAFLLPFLAILGAGMLAQSVSAGFEWVYPLRVLSAAVLLWRFRASYSGLKWTTGPGAVAIGAAVGAVWIAAERILAPASAPMSAPAAWLAAAPFARWAWMTFRVMGGVVTVPIAEELAFRGYVLRRLISSDFPAVDPRRFTWLSFLLSSLIFGLLHGQRWGVGVLAGMLFAYAQRRRGSIGDAVVAHSTANLLLAAWVFATGDWRFW